MDAAATQQRRIEAELAGDKAAKDRRTMRRSVATRGIAGPTFDHVAREAGVSRGLLHYYFQTKGACCSRSCAWSARPEASCSTRSVANADDADGLIDGLVTAFCEALGLTAW